MKSEFWDRVLVRIGIMIVTLGLLGGLLYAYKAIISWIL